MALDCVTEYMEMNRQVNGRLDLRMELDNCMMNMLDLGRERIVKRNSSDDEEEEEHL